MKYLFSIKGIVIAGKKRGKSLGFPTANFKVDTNTPAGIYLSTTTVENIEHPSITFIGTVETYDEKDFVGESYILNFDKDIYGQMISVNFIKKIRDNQKFESTEKLIAQMKEDKQQARKYFAKTAISH